MDVVAQPPQIPEDGFAGKSGAGDYGDYIVQLDHRVGKVVDVLRETGLEKNTRPKKGRRK